MILLSMFNASRKRLSLLKQQFTSFITTFIISVFKHFVAWIYSGECCVLVSPPMMFKVVPFIDIFRFCFSSPHTFFAFSSFLSFYDGKNHSFEQQLLFANSSKWCNVDDEYWNIFHAELVVFTRDFLSRRKQFQVAGDICSQAMQTRVFSLQFTMTSKRRRGSKRTST